MAKAKVKLDLSKVKSFLINHVEKLVLGLFGLFFLLLVYGMLGVESMDRTPQELSSAVSQAQDNLARSQFNLAESGVVVKDYSQQAQAVTKEVLLAGYDWLPVNPPVWPPGDKRRRPELLALESVQVKTGLAAFDLRPEATPVAEAEPAAEGDGDAAARPAAQPARSQQGGLGSRLQGGLGSRLSNPLGGGNRLGGVATGPASAQGMRYAVVLGLVPIERQIKAYQEAFAGVAHPRPETDERPKYRTMEHGIAAWVQRAELKPGVPDDQLTWVWLDSPRTPQNNNRPIKDRYNGAQAEPADPSVVDPALTEPLPPLAGAEWDPRTVVHDQLPLAPESPADGNLQPAAPANQPMPVLPPGVDPMPVEAPAAPSEPAADTPATPEQETQPYLLFRYFDFTAQPGKSYKYRVVLTIDNPNYEIDPTQLELDRDEAQKEVARAFVYTPASELSPPGTLPFDGSLYAGEIVAANASNEVGAKIAIEQWLPSGGSVQQVVERVVRGKLMNFSPLDKAIVVPAGGGAPELGAKGKDYSVRTELAVLDMMGQEAADKGPANLLLMNSSGQLAIRKGTSDQDRFTQIDLNVKDAAEAKKKEKEDDKKGDGLGKSKLSPPSGGLGARRNERKQPDGNQTSE